MSIRERNENANKRIEAATQQQQEDGIDRETQEEAQVGEIHEGEVQEDESSRHHCIIGDLVAGYFPTVRGYKLGTDDEERIRLEAFLFVLSVDPDLVDKLKGQADQLVSEDPDGEWRVPV